MKKNYVTNPQRKSLTLGAGALALSIFAGSAQAQNEKGFELESLSSTNMSIDFHANEFSFKPVQINGTEYKTIASNESSAIGIKGAPDLPKFAQAVIIPNEGNPSVEVTHSGYTDYENVEIAPHKGKLYRNIDPTTVPYEFGDEYDQDQFFPGKLVDVRDPYILRDYRGQTILTYPYQYNPVTKTLRVYHDLEINMNFNKAEEGINELFGAERATTKEFTSIYNQRFLNASKILNKRYTPMDENGKLLIITDPGFTDEIEPLVTWKKQSGIETEVVTTDATGTTASSIKSYINTYYGNNSTLTSVLFVGDHAEVPSYSYGTTWAGEELWSDTYYGFLSGNDYRPEIFVGRLSSSSSTRITTMVNRLVEYEKTPATGNFYKNAIMLGSNEGPGDDGEYDNEHLANIAAELNTFGFNTVHEFYQGTNGGNDAPGEPQADDITDAVETGASLFFYTGHGDQNTCITGNYGSSDVNGASNNGKYPFMVSVACNNGTFTSGTCISETWMNAKNGNGPTGSINACGSSILMAWAPPMETQDEITKILTEQYSNNKKVTIGGLFYNAQMSMMDDHNDSEVMQTWVMFGDPTTMIRTDAPTNLTATHASATSVGATSIDVTCNVEGALVAVSQDGELLGKGIVSGGSVTINFAALSSSSQLTVTGTKYNYSPYIGSVNVTAGINDEAFGNIEVYPNPAQDYITVYFDQFDSKVNMTIKDMSGKTVLSKNTISNSNKLDVSNLSNGMYILTIQSETGLVNQKIEVKR